MAKIQNQVESRTVKTEMITNETTYSITSKISTTNFSKSDKRFSELNKVIGYLGTPSGAIKKYNPVTDEVTVIRSGTASDLESNSFL